MSRVVEPSWQLDMAGQSEELKANYRSPGSGETILKINAE